MPGCVSERKPPGPQTTQGTESGSRRFAGRLEEKQQSRAAVAEGRLAVEQHGRGQLAWLVDDHPRAACEPRHLETVCRRSKKSEVQGVEVRKLLLGDRQPAKPVALVRV